ncbi:hypothetical protein ASD81_20160 [Nocardioides sp. Root614]|nr:hypothetical protein ASD81_20160 [Nocardioides sp. Root614]KRA86925.1 hypothetical protein ASD84_22375 [Nocardioides sp. Root682]
MNLAVSRDEGVVTVALDWSGHAGPIDARLADRLTDLLIELATDPAVRAVVITGTGDVFATGRDDLPEVARLVAVLQAVPFVTVAAVQRVCIGAGLALALACRHRVIAGDAVLCATPGTGSRGTARALVYDEIGPDAGQRMLGLGAVEPAALVAWGVAATIVPGHLLLARAQETALRGTPPAGICTTMPPRKAPSRRATAPRNVWPIEQPFDSTISGGVR